MIYIVETDLLKEWSRRAWTSTPNLVSSFWAGLVDIVLLRLYLLLFDFPYIRIVYQEFALIHSCPDLSIGLIQLRNIRITFTLLSDECDKIRETLWRTTRQVKCPSNLSCYTCLLYIFMQLTSLFFVNIYLLPTHQYEHLIYIYMHKINSVRLGE